MKVRLYRRDFTDLAVQPDVIFEVERYSHSVFGGSKNATIQATGKEEDLFELINHLREPIEIINERGDCVWHGYVHDVTVNTDVGRYGVSLDSMSNRVAVAYTIERERYTTDWSGDDDSIGEFGIKELLLSKSDITNADALQTRDVHLAKAKNLIPILKFSSDSKQTATLNCLGWLETLQWQYYENDKGYESNTDKSDNYGQKIGTSNGRSKLAQSFQIETDYAWDATSIALWCWYDGDDAPPTDNLVVSIRSDNAGNPGAIIESGSIAASELSDRSDWVEIQLDNPVTLNPSTTYWIHVQRSGAWDNDAYCVVASNRKNPYPRGLMYFWFDGLGIWRVSTGNTPHDLLFKINGDEPTTDQIEMLLENCGQFFQGTIIENESGINTNPYRSGDTAGLYEFEKLLRAGTSNNRRLLCEVTRTRYLRIYEENSEPSKAVDSYALDKKGQLLTSTLTPIDISLCPVGIWCHLQDVIPARVDFSLISDPSLFFIDEAEYNVNDDEYNILVTRDQGNPLDIGGVIQG